MFYIMTDYTRIEYSCGLHYLELYLSHVFSANLQHVYIKQIDQKIDMTK